MSSTALRSDEAYLTKAIRTLKKRDSLIDPGKQVRQLPVGSGADAAAIGHTVPSP